ncbi:hypothetical protein LVB77_17405 [Lysobacter sp. 5GHs7-4]|nr:hypothetical protein [Lysobacter sp. 5GHs7-4]UHQ22421.1 hypothetical protein LVB77_17405 [Lysobacter sp. 5GHs7-4]
MRRDGGDAGALVLHGKIGTTAAGKSKIKAREHTGASGDNKTHYDTDIYR